MKTKKFLKKLGIKSKIKGKITHLSLSNDHLDSKTAFIALKGQYHDALTDVNQKNLQNVGIVLTYKEMFHPKIIYLQNLKYRLSQMVSILYPQLLKNVSVIGVCGTCGKTTTATMITHLLKNNKQRVAYIGTGKIQYGDEEILTNNTTLNPIEFVHHFLNFKSKPQYLVLEVSSHAILENRINFIHFNALVFTNFSQDHLDFHLNMTNYFEVKKSLFLTLSKKDVAIINIDDKKGMDLIASIHSNVITYGKKFGKYTLKDYSREDVLSYNQYNLLATYALGKYFNIQEAIIQKTLDEYSFDLGRSQILYDKKFMVILDYAHTPNALKNLLMALKKQYQRKITLVFGCGGNRDKQKRKIMGKIAMQYATQTILTNDNPRDENPQDIIQDILKSGLQAKVILSRKEAIDYSITHAKENDIIAIVGKGNEDFQLIKQQKILHNDKQCILERLKSYE